MLQSFKIFEGHNFHEVYKFISDHEELALSVASLVSFLEYKLLSQCYRNELILSTIVLEWQHLMSFVWRLITATKYSNIVSISNNTSTSYYIYGINIATTNAVFSPTLACTQAMFSPTLACNQATFSPSLACNQAMFSPTLACNQATFSPSLVPRPRSRLASYPGHVLA